MLWCLRLELNQCDLDFQSSALPAELPRHIKIGYCSTINYLQGPLTKAYGGKTGVRTLTKRATTSRADQLHYFPHIKVLLPPRAPASLILVDALGFEPTLTLIPFGT